jgi:hypothetical protein
VSNDKCADCTALLAAIKPFAEYAKRVDSEHLIACEPLPMEWFFAALKAYRDADFSYSSYYRPPNPTTSKATTQLRFVERIGMRILQQGWEVTTFDGSNVGVHLEWRDVPNWRPDRGGAP